jgi:uncharacterized protein (DUF4415 family)
MMQFYSYLTVIGKTKMAKRLSGSSQRGRQPARKGPSMTAELLVELAELRSMTDDQINTSDIPERLDWSNAEVGKFYKPIKTQISLRVDADILDWFKARSEQYTSLMNQALRTYVTAAEATLNKSAKRKKKAG